MMNFTLIKQSINHLKVGLIVNSAVVLYQIATHLKLFPTIGFHFDTYGLEEIATTAVPPLTQNTTEPIQGVASIMLLENSKLYFLLVYIAIIVLLVIFLETINRKKKQNVEQAIDGKDIKGYFIEKILTANRKIDRSLSNDKEIMSCEVKDEILKKLLLFEEGTKFTDKNFNLSALSVKLKTNTKYLSYIINKYKKKDFNSYINELRILYIIKKMESNPAYLNYKISYLADECGFSSHSKFTAIFKTVVGMSPSQFMEELARKQLHTK